MTAVSDVKPGDVLLFRGTGLIPWAIRLFDGGTVNHAAIALGGTDLAEAAGNGLQRRGLNDETSSVVFTEVRRLENTDLTPVLDRASSFLADGDKYAYHQIVLLALLAVTRRIPAPWAARRLIRSALDHAATAVGDLIPTGKTRMICSEFVYRCYAEAAPPSPIAVDLATVFAVPASVEPTMLDWALTQSDREVQLAPAATFAAGFDAAVAEAELEQRILEYADAANLTGVLPRETAPSTTFALPGALEPEPTDDEILASMGAFGTALQASSPGGAPDAAFAIDLAAIGTVALKGALQGIADVSVDANFVTPRDLEKATSLVSVGRITPS